MELRGGPQPTWTSSDTIVIDVFLDATGPITLLSVAVLSTAGPLTYCGVCSAALPQIHPGPPLSGAQPSYILYAPAAGTQAAQIMYPQQTPFFLTFPSPPCIQQININYAEPSFGQTQATGNNIWIASLVYHILGAGPSVIEISLEPTSAIVSNGGQNITDQVVLTGGPFFINVPEPTTALLIGFGLLGLGLAGSRKL